MSILSSFSFGVNKINSRSLVRLNQLVAGIYFLQAILILLLSDSSRGSRPVTTNFLTTDKLATDGSGHSVIVSATHRLFDLNLTYIVLAFLLVSSLGYLLTATRYRKMYEDDLKNSLNHLRWITFSVSAAFMMVAIGLVAGVYDLSSLIMIAGLSALAALLGLLLETVRPANWLHYWLGVGALVVVWKVVIIHLWGAHVWGSSVPGYVYGIVISMLLFSAALVINTGFQRQKIGHWEKYLFGERMFIILNLLAQTALAWQIYLGTLK